MNAVIFLNRDLSYRADNLSLLNRCFGLQLGFNSAIFCFQSVAVFDFDNVAPERIVINSGNFSVIDCHGIVADVALDVDSVMGSPVVHCF